MPRLTPAQVADIRSSDESAKVLAQRHGVTRPTISNCRNGIHHGDGTAKRRTVLGRPPVERTQDPCGCGCGQLANPGRRFIKGHFSRTDEARRKCNPSRRLMDPSVWIAKTLANCSEEDRGHDTLCLIWRGALNRTTGYATTKIANKTITRHRHLFEITHGVELPRALHVDHRCNQRDCLNVEHLQAITPRDNIRRSRIVTPMTPESVSEMRTLRDLDWTYRRLGERFGIAASSAAQICSGKRWGGEL